MNVLNRLIYTFISLFFLALANQAHAQSTLSTQQQGFIFQLLPAIYAVNGKIRQQRQHLLALEKRFNHSIPIKPQDMAWLKQLAKRYRVKPADFFQFKTWATLKRRVNIIPPPLILAQAANESAWGRSRFAKEANNYFGQWCSVPGCGLVPKKRPAGRRYEVKKFPSIEASVAACIHNLNTNRAYSKLRQIRAELLQQDKPIDAMHLAAGLKQYSARGDAYILSIRNLIHHYQLVQVVQNFQTS